jgi:alkylation response protein AidB-like acyl-CoA dehydrogenase
MTGANSGSDVAAETAPARRQLVINGSKMWISNGNLPISLVFARRTKPKASRHYCVPRGRKAGFSSRNIHNKLGLAIQYREIILHDCSVPAEIFWGGGRRVQVGMCPIAPASAPPRLV